MKTGYFITGDELNELARRIAMEVIDQMDGKKAETTINADNPILSYAEALQFLKCSKATLWRYRANGLKFMKKGNKVFFKKEDIIKFLEK